MLTAPVALVAATALHLGFQATVTTVVYPALARVPAGDWQAAHRAHSRAISPIVVVVYGALVTAGGWALWAAADGWTWVAVAAAGAAMLVTATVAAPAHQRLGSGRDRRIVDRLLRADRVRTAAAVLALAAAVAALW